ncbi:MAG: aromatic ring-hydroxylating dioxygenase subunit alpha [Tistlia sp.]|uniref:aromatic ring-hydroxylating dioxygenase subunit alpha n=1 Tax=Tistlia sp. TaxID=3057121 RepID=UPI0034A3D59D
MDSGSMPGAQTAKVDLSGPRRSVEQASHAPGAIYHSPEIYEREVEVLFKKEWLFVGRVEELPNPGDYATMRICGEPIVVARDRKGQLSAFYNMCVHRGVEVAEGSGNARSFKCPYHGWVYDLEGKLKGAAHMDQSVGFDKANCRMRPLRLELWRGSIFVCFDLEGRPFEEAIAPFEKDFGFLQMDRCRLGNKIRLELNCNWKFVPENIMDFYHVNVLHAGTFGSNFTWSNDDVVLRDRGEFSIWYQAAPPTPGGELLLGKMPWMEDREVSFASHGFMMPNLTIFGRIDCVRPFVAWPLGPDRCEVFVYHLFPEEVFERPDIEEKLAIYEEYQLKVLGEDSSMMESMQRAMSSPTYVAGRMSALEKPLHHYLNGYLDRIFGDRGAGTGAGA